MPNATPAIHSPDETCQAVRIATFNASLSGNFPGEMRERLIRGHDDQAEAIAATVQTVRPDILLVNEIDHDERSDAARLLADKYFAADTGKRKPLFFPHVSSVPSNTGVDSGLDLNNDNRRGESADAWGYGSFPGQYAMAVYSRFPIKRELLRTFQRFRWVELPGALRPVCSQGVKPFHEDVVWNQLRLSSKNHADIPIQVGSGSLHLLVSHPTPPVFDGPSDRNSRRNHDEIRFWSDYLEGPGATHLVDDQGRPGGLCREARFVIAGDLNADPHRGEGRKEGIGTLLRHPRISDPEPSRRFSRAGPSSANRSASATADFGPNGKLRVDYVLPSTNLRTIDAGVFWPAPEEPGHQWLEASDHRLVWVDISFGTQSDCYCNGDTA